MKIYATKRRPKIYDRMIGKDLWILIDERGTPNGIWVQIESRHDDYGFYIVHTVYNDRHSAARFERERRPIDSMELSRKSPKSLDLVTTEELREMLVDEG